MKTTLFLFLILLVFAGFTQENIKNQIRNLNVDDWVATDALGRKLPTFEECGLVKKDRFVGMFYFMTHTNPGGKGPFDVTKIMKVNPENPKWVKVSISGANPKPAIIYLTKNG